jgi:uncharacterized paraquat-inducible protein A
MKCPHCNYEVSRFSPSINSLSAAGRRCPHCSRPVNVHIGRKKALLLALVTALMPMLLAFAFLALALPPIYSQLSLLVGLAIVLVSGIVTLRNMALLPADAPEHT